MTLILTCLTHEHIVQVADRRLTQLDGSLADDDTNKVVFFQGRVAIAFAGISRMDGMPTADWIAYCIKDEEQTEAAMRGLAARAQRHLQLTNYPDKRLAIVATGWATFQGKEPLRPFICVASNFITSRWHWEPIASAQMNIYTGYLPENSSHFVFGAGQNLTKPETVQINRSVRRAVEHKATARAIVRILGETVQLVTDGSDERAQRVGRGMIIQLLSRQALHSGRIEITTPLTPDAHSFVYVSPAGRTNSFKGPRFASRGVVLSDFGGGIIPPSAKGYFRTQQEASARQTPILLSSTDIRYSAQCPFCASEARRKGSSESLPLVTGDLPLTASEAWIYCGGDTGHLLLIQRTGG